MIQLKHFSNLWYKSKSLGKSKSWRLKRIGIYWEKNIYIYLLTSYIRVATNFLFRMKKTRREEHKSPDARRQSKIKIGRQGVMLNFVWYELKEKWTEINLLAKRSAKPTANKKIRFKAQIVPIAAWRLNKSQTDSKDSKFKEV